MNEKILHHLWKYQRFTTLTFFSTDNQNIQVLEVGKHNNNQGTDFYDVKLKIDDVIWFGTIEIHVKSSDFYKHHHQKDFSYSSIILHVVYYHDLEIQELKQKKIPTLELKSYVDNSMLLKIKSIDNDIFQFIPCEHLLIQKENQNFNNEFKTIYLQKLEEKSQRILNLFHQFEKNWEATFLAFLAYSFGLKINADIFQLIIQNIDFKFIKKASVNRISLEALFFGTVNELSEGKDEHQKMLKKEYEFLQHKFNLKSTSLKLKYLRLRPQNFPTLRLSQFAYLTHKNQNLFSLFIDNQEINRVISTLKEVSALSYWENHCKFGNPAKLKNNLFLSDSFIELILINCVIPFQYTYFSYLNNPLKNNVLDNIKKIQKEENSILDKWKSLNINLNSAFETQSLLYLYKNYCSKKKCMSCELLKKII